MMVSPRWAVLLAVGACKINFDPSSFDSCALAAPSAAATFRWDGNDHCYSLHLTPVEYDIAWDACNELGAHLVTYRTSEEHVAVREALAPAIPTWLGTYNGGAGYLWATGEAPVYSNWAAGEPGPGSAGVEDPDGTWRSEGADFENAFVCERSVVVTSDRVYTLEPPAEWEAARQACETQGAHLATIASGTEALVVDPLFGNPRWVGARGANGEYAWITGEAFAYSNWAASQPDVTTECLAIRSEGWFAEPCNGQYRFICEYE